MNHEQNYENHGNHGELADLAFRDLIWVQGAPSGTFVNDKSVC